MTDSQELINSQRRFDKATYTPLVTRQPDSSEVTDVLGRAILVRSLELKPDEVNALREQSTEGSVRETLEIVAAIAHPESAQRGLEAATALVRIPTNELTSLAESLHSLRGERIEQIKDSIRTLVTSYDDAVKRANAVVPFDTTSEQSSETKPATSSTPNTVPPTIDQLPTPNTIHSDAEAGLKFSTDVATSEQLANLVQIEKNSISPIELLASSHFDAVLNRPALGSMLDSATLLSATNMLDSHIVMQALNTLTWAAQVEPEQMEKITNLAKPYVGAAMIRELAPIAALPELKRLQGLTVFFVDALNRRPLEPVGLLHLERLDMTPLEIERGELLYSLPLAPLEKVTLAHKEWTTRQEQFERYIQDYLENYSERGVVESEDISMSSETQTRHTNALSMSHATAENGSITLSTPVDTTTNIAQSSVENLESQQESKLQTRTVTAKASTRTIKDHKVSFTVATVTGTEDFTARLIVNPYDDRALRIDYFRRMRRWRSDLYRYGVRMTYDVVLPDPGRELRGRYMEIQHIDARLAAGFQFNVAVSAITHYNWRNYADWYGVALPPPPDQRQLFEDIRPVDHNFDANTPRRIEERQVTIPDGYTLQSLTASANTTTWQIVSAKFVNVFGGGEVGLFEAGPGEGLIDGSKNFNVAGFPKKGNVKVVFICKFVEKGVLRLVASAVPTEVTMETWRMQCWQQLQQAAYTKFAQERDRLRERRASLQREIDAVDAVTLRRMEREQIMRLVLDWLFPGFGSINASGILDALNQPSLLDAGTWQQVMEYGEYIKFVHSAIDWDNVMVLLFPYFWDSERRQSEKLFFNHHDPQHREFIRAGAARVVLAIRPGFEQEVVSLLDQGKLGTLPDGHRFQKVVDDVQEANKKYLEMTQAQLNNADETENPRQPGILIGSWHDYTPTGALDIEVEMIAVNTNGLPLPMPHP